MRASPANTNRITARSLVLGILFAALFAILTVYFENRKYLIPTANQIPVLPYMLLLTSVLLLNPLCRLLRVVRQLSMAEILVVFTMGMVSSGISTFGLSAQLVPVIGAPFNQHWNTQQTEWNRYVVPFLNEHFFISEPGIRAAARDYCDAVDEAREMRKVDEMTARDRGAAETVATGAAYPSQEAAQQMERIRSQAELIAERKAVLVALEENAMKKVAVFRRGLPRELRAYPGFLPLAGDDANSYFGRMGRLVYGKRAAQHLRRALAAMRALPSDATLSAEARRAVAGRLKIAADILAPLGAADECESAKLALGERDTELAAAIVEFDRCLVELNERKRRVAAEAAKGLAREIRKLERRKERLNQSREKLATRLERALLQIEVTARVAAVLTDLKELRNALSGEQAAPHPVAAVRRRINDALARFPSFDASWRRCLLGDVPWWHWTKPLLRWGLLIGFTYILLMTFNVLIFRQWAHNEKLIYPLAELPEILVGREDGGTRVVPDVFRSGLFWLGLAVSGGFMGWNLLAKTGAVPGLKPFDLGNWWGEYTRNTALAGLGSAGRSSIFFTMIGLAFLIPKHVSFSMWFFYVLFMVQTLVLVWTGYGVSLRSFPSEWWYTWNFCSAEASGALVVFASVVLFKCRKYLLSALWPASVRDLAVDDRRELRISSALFLACSAGLVVTLWRGMGANLYYAVFAYAIIMVVTIGLVRAVAEGGVLGFQAHIGPFHFVRHLFGFNKAWTSASLFAPLMVYHAVLFLDIKTFIAPAMANCLKIRDDLRLARGRFHAAMALAIFGSAAVAVVVTLMMCYDTGADAMHRWFHVGFPQGLFNRVADVAKTPPTPTSDGALWLLFGAGAMAALLFFRQRIFWLPHPIGLIMLVNPLIGGHWFSILLGWMAKTLVAKYGNKSVYVRARGFFVGLIVGEIAIVALAMTLSYAMNKNLGIDLNR
ncbi:MAG: hypothetical protein JXR37_10850 [Kiritimatiellae bacterium]|nr:hypothetical protein [Kiritimatiellia bacterium]